MKKQSLLTFIIVLFFLNSYSQPEGVYEQEFIVKNFKIVPANTLIQKALVTVTFDLEMSNPMEEYFDYPFYITPALTHSSDEVYSNIDNKGTFYARPSYSNKNIAYERYIKLEIPYEMLELPTGEQIVNISLNVWNDEHNFGKIFTKKINILIPKLYDYQEQEFDISSFSISNNFKKFDLQGISVNFNCKLKFYSHQTKGLINNEELKNYYFYIELYDKETGIKYDFFENKQNFYKLDITNLTKNISFFIPYQSINIPQGKHTLIAKLKVSDLYKTISFGEVAQTEFIIDQPLLYLCKLNITSLEATYHLYDKTTIVGQVFSKKTSDVGKGYPEIFWNLELGELIQYQSEINKNSFIAATDSVYFTVADKTPINITVWDFDLLNKNEFISNINIPNINGGSSASNSGYYNSAIEKLNYSFQKIRFPYLKQKTITVNPYKYKGVSGIEVNFQYELSEIFDNESFIIQPIIMAQNNISPLTNYIDLQSEASNEFKINRNSLQNTIKIFVPYFALAKNSQIGFDITSKQTSYNLSTPFYPNEIIIPQINDINVKIDKISEIQNNDFYGLKVDFKYDIPELYISNFGLKNFRVNMQIKNKTTAQPANNITEIFPDEINNLTNFYINDEKNKSIFIPFYLIGTERNTYEFIINQTIKTEGTNLKVCNTENSFKTTVSGLNTINISKISFMTKKLNDYDKIYLTIKHGENIVMRTEPIAISKKMKWDITKAEILTHQKDNLTLTIFGINEYGLSTEIYSKQLKSKEFSIGDKIKLRGNKNIKKILIDVE